MIPADRNQYRLQVYNILNNFFDKNSYFIDAFPLDIESGIIQSSSHLRYKRSSVEYLSLKPTMLLLYGFEDISNLFIKKDYNYKYDYLINECDIKSYNNNKNKLKSKDGKYEQLNTNKICSYINITPYFALNRKVNWHYINFLNEYKTISDTTLINSNSLQISIQNIQTFKSNISNDIKMNYQYITKKPKVIFQADIYGTTQLRLLNYYTLNDSTNILNKNTKTITVLHALFDYYYNNTEKYIQTVKRKLKSITNQNNYNLKNDTTETVLIDNTSFVLSCLEIDTNNKFDIYNINNINIILDNTTTFYKTQIIRPYQNLFFKTSTFSRNSTFYNKILNNIVNLTYIIDENNQTLYLNNYLNTIFNVNSNISLVDVMLNKHNYSTCSLFKHESDMPLRFPNKHEKETI